MVQVYQLLKTNNAKHDYIIQYLVIHAQHILQGATYTQCPESQHILHLFFLMMIVTHALQLADSNSSCEVIMYKHLPIIQGQISDLQIHYG